METEETEWPRSTLPDAVDGDELILIKAASTLRATYQIRLLTYMAAKGGKVLVIDVPPTCVIHEDLQSLARRYAKHIRIQSTP